MTCVVINVSGVGGANTHFINCVSIRRLLHSQKINELLNSNVFWKIEQAFIINYREVVSMSEKKKLKITDFIQEDRFELNSYIIQLFNHFNNVHPCHPSR